MAIPTFVASGGRAAGTAAVTPVLPAGIAVNDILLLFAESNSGEAVTIPTPNGGTWAEVADSPQDSTDTRLTVFWSRYNGTQGAPTTNDPGNHICCFIAAWNGVITTGDPWDVTSGGIDNTSDTSASITGDTTTVADCIVIAACCNGTNANQDQFSGWTNGDLASPATAEREDVNTNKGGGGGVGMADGGKASAGAYGATTVTLGTASTKGFITIALKPAAGDQTLTPAPVTAAWSVPAPTIVLGGVTISPAAVVATWVVPAPNLAVDVILTPAAVVATWVVPAVIISSGVVLTPAAVVAAWVVIAPTLVLGGVTLTPAAVVATWVVPAPTIVLGGVTLSPAPVTAVWGVPAVVITNVTPSGIVYQFISIPIGLSLS